MGTIAWVRPFMSMLPGVGGMRRFMRFARDSVLDRKLRGSSRKDIFYYLVRNYHSVFSTHRIDPSLLLVVTRMQLDEEGLGSSAPSLPTLMLESSLAIVAGKSEFLSPSKLTLIERPNVKHIRNPL